MNNSPESISVVTSLYYSDQYIQEFYRRCKSVIDDLGLRYEFIFVEDGRTDNSVSVIKSLMEKEPNITLVELSRNFGHQAAMLAGLSHAKNDLIFALDVDLEEPPECLFDFYKTMSTNYSEIDAVVGIMNKRDNSSIERLTGDIFYRLFNTLSSHKIVKNQLWARLLKRNVVEAFIEHKEFHRFASAIFAISGFRTTYVKIDKTYKGRSSYSLSKRLSAAFDAITSFSTKPLLLVFYTGLLGFSLSTIVSIAIIFSRLFIDYFSGWLSTITLIILFGSLNLMAIGIIGVYLAKVYIEVKKRPHFIVRNVFGK